MMHELVLYLFLLLPFFLLYSYLKSQNERFAYFLFQNVFFGAKAKKTTNWLEKRQCLTLINLLIDILWSANIITLKLCGVI